MSFASMAIVVAGGLFILCGEEIRDR